MSVENNSDEYVEFDFDDIKDDYKEFLIKLPYRVGFYISQSDKTGGDESDIQEMEAIETMIISRTQDMCKSAFMQKLMEGTVAEYDYWEDWEDSIEEVPEECRKAVKILSEYVSDKELNNFCQNMMEIGLAVAESFREYNSKGLPVTKGLIPEMLSKLFPPKYPEFCSINISKDERFALIKLKESLSEGMILE